MSGAAEHFEIMFAAMDAITNAMEALAPMILEVDKYVDGEMSLYEDEFWADYHG